MVSKGHEQQASDFNVVRTLGLVCHGQKTCLLEFILDGHILGLETTNIGGLSKAHVSHSRQPRIVG